MCQNRTYSQINADLTDYLPLSGGTMTGALTLHGVLYDNRLTEGSSQVLNGTGTTLYVGNTSLSNLQLQTSSGTFKVHDMIPSSGTITTVQGYSNGSCSITYYKIGNIVVCNGTYTTGSSVASDLNNALFALPYTPVAPFNFISSIESDIGYVNMYGSTDGYTWPREALSTSKTYNIAFTYLTND